MSDEEPADTGKVLWPEANLGPFRYAVVGGIAFEYKDGKWFDKDGNVALLSLRPPTGGCREPSYSQSTDGQWWGERP